MLWLRHKPIFRIYFSIRLKAPNNWFCLLYMAYDHRKSWNSCHLIFFFFFFRWIVFHRTLRYCSTDNRVTIRSDLVSSSSAVLISSFYSTLDLYDFPQSPVYPPSDGECTFSFKSLSTRLVCFYAEQNTAPGIYSTFHVSICFALIRFCIRRCRRTYSTRSFRPVFGLVRLSANIRGRSVETLCKRPVKWAGNLERSGKIRVFRACSWSIRLVSANSSILSGGVQCVYYT